MPVPTASDLRAAGAAGPRPGAGPDRGGMTGIDLIVRELGGRVVEGLDGTTGGPG
jgi:hypothetical protein